MSNRSKNKIFTIPDTAQHMPGTSSPVALAAFLAREAGVLADMFARGQFSETEESALLLLKKYDDWLSGWNIVGVCRRMLKKYDAAVLAFNKAISLSPNDPDIYNNLGPVLQEQGKLQEAIECYQRAITLKPGFAEAHNNLGNAMRELEKLPEAIGSYRRAITLKPDYAEAHNNLGCALEEQGNLAAARESYEKALALNPEFAKAHKNYATCRKFTRDDKAHIDRLETLIQGAQNDEDRCSLHYALGKIYDDCRMYDESFFHYLCGNQIERKKYSYSWKKFSSRVDSLIREFPAGYLLNRTWTGSPAELPVFIVGMPRSGTTLTEQILASHPLVYGAGELKYFDEKSISLPVKLERPYPECLKLLPAGELKGIAEEYSAYLRRLSPDAERVTDKMPWNFLHLGFIALLFPRARVIHCRRSPLDTCLSIFFQRFTGRHPYSSDLGDLGHYYRDYERLMEHWRKVLPPGMLLEVAYEEMVENPEEMSRKLIGFCGLEWNERCLKFNESDRAVRTASSWQVRQPIYKTSKERWKRYERHLGPLIEALEGKQQDAGDGMKFGETERLIRSALEQYTSVREIEGMIREVLKTDKDTFDTLAMLGIKEGQRGNDADAEKLFRHALAINSTSAETLHNLGLILVKQGKLDEAVVCFRKAVALKPAFIGAQQNLEKALQQQRVFSETTEG